VQDFRTSFAGAVAAIAIVALPLASASAQTSLESFYKGKPVTIVVAAGAGGPFGLRASLLSQYLGRHLPGSPTVVAQYMPGAGGRKAANYVYNAAPKDGGTFGIVFYNTAMSYRLEPKGAAFEPLKFNWLGSQDSIHPLIFVWHTAPATTLAKMKETELVFGATGATSPTGIYPLLLNAIAGTKIRIVKGYASVPEYISAAEKGEIHGAMTSWDSLTASYMERVRNKEIIPVVQISPQRLAELPDVPILSDVATTDEGRKLAEFLAASSLIGHTNVAPPGVPAERLAALKSGIAATYRDPDAIESVRKTGSEIKPVSADDVRKAVERVMAAPEDLVAKARTAVGFN